MIRACAALDVEGILVDSDKFPTLSRCVIKSGEPPLTVLRAKALLQIQENRRKQSAVSKTTKAKTEAIKN